MNEIQMVIMFRNLNMLMTRELRVLPDSSPETGFLSGSGPEKHGPADTY
jgi:hypothetical protein